MQERILKRDYISDEFAEMPEELKIALEPDSEEKLEEIRKIISDNQPLIKSINIDPSAIFDADYSEFEKCNFRVGVEYITVYEKRDWWLVVNCKRDASLLGEYSLKIENEEGA